MLRIGGGSNFVQITFSFPFGFASFGTALFQTDDLSSIPQNGFLNSYYNKPT